MIHECHPLPVYVHQALLKWVVIYVQLGAIQLQMALKFVLMLLMIWKNPG